MGRKAIDLVGRTYGRWTVLSRAENDGRHVNWHVMCDCGTERIIRGSYLKNRHSKSCGCIRGKFVDLTGQVFGYLTIVSLAEKRNRSFCWNCICICGGTVVVRVNCLKTGNTRSCGCLVFEAHTTHGMSKTNEYKTWSGMLQRCNNPKHAYYKDYGGRGIKVCKSWHKFENFYSDMGPKPENLTLERIDNDKGYGPDNCKWATNHMQILNRRGNKKQGYYGVQKASKNSYKAIIKKESKTYRLGNFPTKIEAAKAYDNKCEELYGYRPNET